MDELGQALNAKHETLARGHVSSFLSGGLEGVLESAPTPERSSGSTGRTLASTKTSTGQPNISDPGIRSVYPVPDQQDVDDTVNRWNAFEPAFIAVATQYYPFIDVRYPIIGTATEKGRERLEQDQGTNVRKANDAR